MGFSEFVLNHRFETIICKLNFVEDTRNIYANTLWDICYAPKYTNLMIVFKRELT
jgi:hypothetical protein